MDNRHTRMQQLFTQGAALLNAGSASDALICLQDALVIDPSNPTVNLYTGAALHELGRYAEAVAFYQKTIEIAPEMGEAHNNLGNSLMALGCFAAAADSFSHAAEILVTSPVPLAARASCLQALGNIAEAETDSRKSLLLDPAFAAAHWNLALNLLLQGRYTEGWQEYEWRWQKPDFTSPCRHTNVPLWDGSPLDGRTILLHAEQGFGDAIQFVRYAPLVAQLGGTVIVECHPQLVELFRSAEGVQSVVPFGSPLPFFSFQAPLLSLPGIMGTTLQTIPSICPYLSVPLPYHEKWSVLVSKDSAEVRVGLVWAGKNYPDPLRSCRLAEFAPLAADDIIFFSLQLGHGSEQAQLPPAGMRLVDLTLQVENFADTAALIEQLDLIVTVDTAVAHLAGALCKPVWVLLPNASDWRWLLERSDSPWYPGMRLFRQEIPGDWNGVVARVKTALEDLCQKNDIDHSKTSQVNALLEHGFSDLQKGALESAGVNFALALQLAPDMPDLLCGMADLKYREGKTGEAIEIYRRALQKDPDYYQCLLGLGNALQSVDQCEDALKCYELALVIKPEYAQALNNRGILLRTLGKLAEALENYDRLLALQPDNAEGHFNRSLVLLQSGRFQEGWPEYEWRFLKADPVIQRHLEIPRWKGEPVRDKRILIHAEQGYGDTIQFVRYARVLSEMGAAVLVEAQDASMSALLRCADGVTVAYVRGECNESVVDYQIPIMSLPEVFGTDEHSIPACSSYIAVPHDKAAAWRQRLTDRRGLVRIGIAWAGRREYGNDRNRSIPFETVSELLDYEGCCWYSLQIGERNAAHPNLIDLTHKIHDFSDSAAFISNLDLIITVDSAVAHLAGALGKHVWVTLPSAPDWRWMLNRADSPWYPSMRLFRQVRYGEWSTVIEKVLKSLQSTTKNPLTGRSKDIV